MYSDEIKQGIYRITEGSYDEHQAGVPIDLIQKACWKHATRRPVKIISSPHSPSQFKKCAGQARDLALVSVGRRARACHPRRRLHRLDRMHGAAAGVYGVRAHARSLCRMAGRRIRRSILTTKKPG